MALFRPAWRRLALACRRTVVASTNRCVEWAARCPDLGTARLVGDGRTVAMLRPDAGARLNRLCARLPRLLAEEVEPQSGRMLGNTPLVWSHAELARALYVLDAAQRRDCWSAPGLWAWLLYRYLALRYRHRRARPLRRSHPHRYGDMSGL